MSFTRISTEPAEKGSRRPVDTLARVAACIAPRAVASHAAVPQDDPRRAGRGLLAAAPPRRLRRPHSRPNERFSDLASELVRLNVNVIVTSGTHATLAATRATSTIPIVMADVGDPVSSGLVVSLARPGGNVTGMSELGPGLNAKRHELLKEALPNMSHVAFLWNPANPAQQSSFNEVQAGARALGVTLHSIEARIRKELEQALAAMKQSRPSALLMTGDTVHQRYIGRIVAFTSENQLPAMYQLKEAVGRGG